jgi:addiction module HigA family antidote
MRMAKKLAPLHPGEILREEFLVPLGLSPGALAKAMGVPRTRVERIAAETSGITADTALRLGKALGTSTELWLNLQTRYDVETAERAIGKDLARIARVTGDAA